ncbi:MAG: hypothetical protein K0U98_19910 [Deltaproteobacteria bacterium]|nr:hypothetical protein [Deltaproteobacteria bacterium]
MLRNRIQECIADPSCQAFETLALEAFRFQYERIAPYRRLCQEQGVGPDDVRCWLDIPAVPAAAFKTLPLCAAPARETFRSSGTSQGLKRRSVHYQPFPELYRAAIDNSFPQFCLPTDSAIPMLSLIPRRAQVPDSSLSFMIEHLLDRYGSSHSETAFGWQGVRLDHTLTWAQECRRTGEPVMILATALALAQWLELLDEADLHLDLPAGSVLFETGGFKGRRREVKRSDLLTGIEQRLGISPLRVVREYGMTELSSQFYSRTLEGGDPDLFVAPPWTRVRVVDPETLQPVEEGQAGLLAIFDLANLGSAVHLLTEDLGIAEANGFRLAGRAASAELRGCSLTAEEMLL